MRKLDFFSAGTFIALLMLFTASAYAWSPTAPYFPVTYTQAQKNAQISAGNTMVAAEQAAVNGSATSYTIAPGVYRLTGNNTIWLKSGFTLNASGVTLITEGGQALSSPQNISNWSVNGGAANPLIIDQDDAIPLFQAKITGYNSSTNLLTCQLMSGYNLPANTSGGYAYFQTFSASGVWLGDTDNGYSNLTQTSSTTFTMTGNSQYAGFYQIGNYVAWGGGWAPFNIVDCGNWSINNASCYSGAMFAWGHGNSGTCQFNNCSSCAYPGTNRLIGGAAPQMSFISGAVTFNGGEYGPSGDDVANISGGSVFFTYKQTAANVILANASPQVGDQMLFYNGTTWNKEASATVTAVIADTSQTDINAANSLMKSTLNCSGTITSLNQITLNQNVTVNQAGRCEDTTGRPSLTVTNCYFHDSNNACAFKGFNGETFTGNTFTRIGNSGLDLCIDPWWWEGGSASNIVVLGNTFNNCPFSPSKNNGSDNGALTVGINWWNTAPIGNGIFNGVDIENNTFTNSMYNAVEVCNANNVTIKNNTITTPTNIQPDAQGAYFGDSTEAGIFLFSDLTTKVIGNNISYSIGPDILVGGNCNTATISYNTLFTSHGNAFTVPGYNNSALILADHASNVTMTANTATNPGSFAGTKAQQSNSTNVNLTNAFPTNYAANGSFENGLTGWSAWVGSNGAAASTEWGGHSGSYRYIDYSTSAYELTTYQDITVPNGTHTISAWVQSSGGQTICRMETSNYGGSSVYNNITAANTWTQVTATVNVTTGTLRVGFYSKANANNWLRVDDVMVW